MAASCIDGAEAPQKQKSETKRETSCGENALHHFIVPSLIVRQI
jgi:hypothetical protein